MPTGMHKAQDSSRARFREALAESRRIVVKIGSKVLVGAGGRPDRRRMAHLVAQTAQLVRKGYEVVLVSSGAIASGMEALGMRTRPSSVPDLQACAAVGQGKLVSIYHNLFDKEKIAAAQLLLTHDDFERKLSVANLRRTMDHLLRAGVVPVVNENDAVADEEVKAYMSLGDNDHLASLVARQTRSDLLVMLSAVDERPEDVITSGKRNCSSVRYVSWPISRCVEPVDLTGRTVTRSLPLIRTVCSSTSTISSIAS